MKRDRIFFLALFFFAWSLLFYNAITTLLIGLLAWFSYEVIYKKNRRVLILLLSGATSYAVFEAIGRSILKAQIGKTFYTNIDHRLKPNPELGINGDGIRCPHEADDFTADTFNVLFLGDSFCFGLELDNYEDSFPAQVEQIVRKKSPDRKLRSINAGWVSCSPGPASRWLIELGAGYKPDVVIYCLDLTDFYDDLRALSRTGFWDFSPSAYLLQRFGLRSELVELYSNWRLNTAWSSLHGLDRPMPTRRFFVALQPLGASLPDMKETERHLERINAYCQHTLGVPFLIVLLPRHFQYSDRESPHNWEKDEYEILGPYVGEPWKWLDAYKVRSGIPCFNLRAAFESAAQFPLCFDHDPHWNPAGCRVAADAIVQFLESQNFLK
jgi:hypothetical protein